MNALTFEQRQAQQEVLHGVEKRIKEESTIIEKALVGLDENLSRMKNGTVYETAETMSFDYVHARAFRIMFLRGNRYDQKATADQMIRFFEVKQELFGKDKLVKDITIDDLDEDDLACMRTGSVQVAGKDRSNRTVVLTFPGLRAHKIIQNQMRSNYYMFMNVLQSEETQLRGYVTVAYSVGSAFRDKLAGEGYPDLARLVLAVPFHMASYHVCVSGTDLGEYVLYSVLIKAINISTRARFQVHFGTDLECQYSLSTFGIPTDRLPFVPGTEQVSLQRHLDWMQSHIRRGDKQGGGNSSLTNRSTLIEPTDDDFLCVSGKQCHNGGNNRLRQKVREMTDLYTSAMSAERRSVVDTIISEVRQSGGRFLKRTKQVEPIWIELTTEEARSKIYQMFRNNKRLRGASSRQQVSAGTPISGDPLPHDVLLGKFERNGGNVLLLNLVKDRFEEYDRLDRGMKAAVVNDVLQAIKDADGRFLQSSPNDNNRELYEVSNEKAREAISKCFRNYRRRMLQKVSL
ncbi:unnamed protein product [Cylindrotheca closterium]|uniref:DUF6824 domain-containing protein n=1 Tax=Cylindrotheca closterium TaxID=2856 RepID=A0AAD2CH07_9STRA|nr:unnamed protein product [Cylindrotheca closterium]